MSQTIRSLQSCMLSARNRLENKKSDPNLGCVIQARSSSGMVCATPTFTGCPNSHHKTKVRETLSFRDLHPACQAQRDHSHATLSSAKRPKVNAHSEKNLIGRNPTPRRIEPAGRAMRLDACTSCASLLKQPPASKYWSEA